MAMPTAAPARPAGTGGFSGLLGLITLLLCVMAAAATLTAYLVRTGVTPIERQAPPLQPAAFEVLYLHAGQVWSIGQDGRAQRLSAIPATQAGSLRTASSAPDGEHVLLVTAAAGGDRLWLLARPAAAPLPIPAPPATLGPGPWSYLSSTWTGPHRLDLLLVAHSGGATRNLLASIGVPETGTATATTWQLLPGTSAAIALSPDAAQVALIDVRPAAGSFGSQFAVRLQHLHSPRASVAYRYLGSQAPSALAWSPDGGTVAIAVPDLGLAIQKSSGRRVREVADGAFPAAFSLRGASFAYLAGKPGDRQIHVLALHGEADHAFQAPPGDTPLWLNWTPDGRALLYAARRSGSLTLWRIEPLRGHATLLSGDVPDPPFESVPAGLPFAP